MLAIRRCNTDFSIRKTGKLRKFLRRQIVFLRVVGVFIEQLFSIEKEILKGNKSIHYWSYFRFPEATHGARIFWRIVCLIVYYTC